MTAIVLKAFNGLKPIARPRLLAENEAQVALNTRLISGSLEPLRGTTTLKSTSISAPKTIFRYGTSATETNYWLEFLNDTDVMRSPVPDDQFDRLYWTDGINPPKYAPNSMILSSQPYPGASYQLGVPAPTTKPEITAFTAVVNYTPVTREYVLTFYNPTTVKESLPGSVISVQGVDGQKVAFTNLPTSNQGDAGITKKRLYRKVSGTYRRVAEIDLATTTYDDTTTDAALASATVLPTAIGSAPAAPGRAPIVSAGTVTPTASGISRSYVYTIKSISVGMTGGDGSQYTEYFAESAASSVYTVTADTTQTVTISGMSNTLAGTHFRVYRKDTGSTSYQLVAEVPVSQTSVTDVIATTTLGGVYNPDAPASIVPNVAPTGSVNSSTAKTTVSRVYMATYLDASGNESGKSPVSSVISAVDGQTQVTITQSEVTPAGVTKKRIYRQTVTVTNGVISMSDANWKLVIEVTASTTSGVEALADVALVGTFATALRDLPPAPNTSPTTNATIPPKIVPESRTYVYTYVTAYGEEGPPSDASDVVDLDGSGDATLSLAGAPEGNYNITLKRIYRSSTVGSTAQFQYVDEMPVATTSYVDSKTQAELGEVLPSELWVPPPAGLKGIRMMASGAAVGFVGRTVYFSEPNLPHAWPHKYTIDYDIVGIATFGQTVAVLTNAFPFLMQGADPAAMTPTKIETPQACVSKRSIIETGDGVIYASPDGLVSLGSSLSIVTQNLMSRDQWQAYVPSSIDSYVYNNRIHCFYNNGTTRGCMVFDWTGQGAVFTSTDVSAGSAITAGYFDATTDTLYLAQGGNIVRHDKGTALTAVWRSKLFRLPWPQSMVVGQVRASAYPVTLRVYADGVLKHTQTVTSSDHFTLPGGFRGLDWELEIEYTGEVSEIIVATSVAELKAA